MSLLGCLAAVLATESREAQGGRGSSPAQVRGVHGRAGREPHVKEIEEVEDTKATIDVPHHIRIAAVQQPISELVNSVAKATDHSVNNFYVMFVYSEQRDGAQVGPVEYRSSGCRSLPGGRTVSVAVSCGLFGSRKGGARTIEA